MRVNAEEKLAAILVAEVPEFEHLIAHDRARTEAALQLQYHEVIDAAILIYAPLPVRAIEAPRRDLRIRRSPHSRRDRDLRSRGERSH